jgi:hypothetical protein
MDHRKESAPIVSITQGGFLSTALPSLTTLLNAVMVPLKVFFGAPHIDAARLPFGKAAREQVLS